MNNDDGDGDGDKDDDVDGGVGDERAIDISIAS